MAEKTGLSLLRAAFPAYQISKLPKGTKQQNECPASEKQSCKICGGWHHPRIVHLDYVGHAALTDRLLDADPLWSWEPLAYDESGLPLFDASGGLWIKLTVCGHTRLGYGHAASSTYKDVGSREKEVIGDALRNAGMRFGAALDLWHKGDLHVEKEGEVDPAPLPKAPITPTTGVKEMLPLEMQQKVEYAAMRIVDAFAAPDDALAFELYNDAKNVFDADAQVALRGCLPSHVKSSLRKMAAAVEQASLRAMPPE